MLYTRFGMSRSTLDHALCYNHAKSILSTISLRYFMASSLHIHLGNSPEALAQALAEALYETRPHDPMEPLRVGVGQRGMERMVEETIARTHGITANLSTYFPTGLLYRAAYVLADDPTLQLSDTKEITWTPSLLQWAVYAELVEVDIGGEMRGDIYDPLRHWLREARGSARSSSQRVMINLAAQLARVFDAYNLDRPEWHEAWVDEATKEQLRLFDEGGPKDFPDTLAWQPALWRSVHRRLVGKTPSPVALLRQIHLADDRAIERLRSAMPALHLFGMEHIHRLQRRFIQALSDIIPVYLYAPSPTSSWWQDARIRTADQDGVSGLLLGFGQHTRYLHDSLVEIASDSKFGATNTDHYVVPTADHALAHLQRGVLAPNEDTLALYEGHAEDRSLSFHASHGALRQVEVVHDVILSCIDRDPTLEASDFVVLCPQLSTFAPLIEAVFRTTEPRLSYRIEDRSLAHANPVAHTLQLLLQIVDERPTAAALLELLSQRVVHERFDLDEEDQALITRWLGDLDIRWGWNTEERKAAGRPGDTTGTWQNALRRIALGAFMGTDPHGEAPEVSGHIAFTNLGGSEHITAGKFTRFVREVFAAIEALSKEHTLKEWCDLLLGDNPDTAPGLLSRLVHVEGSHSYQLEQVMDTIRDLRSYADAATLLDSPLDADAFRTWLTQNLDEDTGVALTGHGAVSFARLRAARFASARVVLLLGMDDGAFPRPAQLPSWDLRQVNHRANDHNDRDEDLYAMLQALMLAQDHFGIIWSSIDASTGKSRQPALPVLEFQRQIEELIENGKEFIEERSVQHRMHPYSIDTFIQASGNEFSAPFTYQHAWARAALQGASAQGRRKSSPAVPVQYQRPDAEEFAGELDVDTLATRLRNPETTFLREASNIAVPADTFRLHDDDAQRPNALDKFSLYRASTTLVQRSVQIDGGFDPDHISPSLMHRMRVEAPIRPGKLGEATLRAQIQGSTREVFSLMTENLRNREASKRYTWAHERTLLHFNDAQHWTLPDGAVVGADIIYGKMRWDTFLVPWAKLCLEAAQTNATAQRIVLRIHDESTAQLWECGPNVAKQWLTDAARIHSDLWQKAPLWTQAAVRSLADKAPESAIIQLEAINADSESRDNTRFYRDLNNKWKTSVQKGGPSKWATAVHGATRSWRPIWDEHADVTDAALPALVHTLYAPLFESMKDAIDLLRTDTDAQTQISEKRNA